MKYKKKPQGFCVLVESCTENVKVVLLLLYVYYIGAASEVLLIISVPCHLCVDEEQVKASINLVNVGLHLMKTYDIYPRNEL